MAPEYSMGKAITVKADVYSFGVVLLEIVSGRVSADYITNQEAEFLLDKVSGSNRINLLRFFFFIVIIKPNIFCQHQMTCEFYSKLTKKIYNKKDIII
jgi:serine/threonine protein kinase